MSKLTKIQNELKAKKSCYNKFGKYYYRKCEDILEAIKPLLAKHEVALAISDEVKSVGDYTFVEAVVEISSDDKVLARSAAQAGIEKAGGMALPQAFGAASSYARKYALGAMFLLDDTEDADATNTHGDEPRSEAKAAPLTADEAIQKLDACADMSELQKTWASLPSDVKKDEKVIAAKDEAKRVIEENS